MNWENTQFGLICALILLVCVVACDSPPWARCIVANATQTEMKVSFATDYPMFAHACIYSRQDWAANARSCTPGTELSRPLDEESGDKWLEASVAPGGAVEIDRYRYPDIEENPEQNFSIDELQIEGSSAKIAWSGRKEIFNKLHKEGDVPWWPLTGSTPRFVYYYK